MDLRIDDAGADGIDPNAFGRDLAGGWLLGLRNNGVKYVRRPDGGEELYDLRTDPTETRDAHVEQKSVVIQARSLLSSDAAALDATK